MATEAKSVRYVRQKLSSDVEVELCFAASTGDTNDDDGAVNLVVVSNQNTNVLEDRANIDGNDHACVGEGISDGPSPVFYVDLSNFSGRLTCRRIVADEKEVELAVSDNRPLGRQDEGGHPALPLPLQASLEDSNRSLERPVVLDDGDTSTGEISPPVRKYGISRVSMAGNVGPRTSIDSVDRRRRDSRSTVDSNAILATHNRKSFRVSRLRSMLRKGTSMRDVTTVPGLGPGGDPLQTDLHVLVSSTEVTVRRMEEIIMKDPEAVKVTDSQGRLPLHLLASNSDLLEYAEGQCIARQCAILLMEIYADSIVHKDKSGLMPFVFLIQKWVERTHDNDSIKSNRAATNGTKRTIAGAIARITHSGATESAVDAGARSTAATYSERKDSGLGVGTATTSVSSSLMGSSNHFPPVQISEEVEWCFEMLSLAMDLLGGKPLDPTLNARPRLSYRKQRSDRRALAENLASIPQILKTASLLESNTIRSKIMESSAVRRALLCPQSIGPWITGMLLYKKGTSAVTAVTFLLTLSQLSVKDYVGKYRNPMPHDEEQFNAAKLEVYEAVEGLKEIVPSLLILNDDLLDNALATPLIWFVMSRHVTTPFTVGISTTDFQLLLTTIIAVQQASDGSVADQGTPEVFPFLSVLSVVFFACLYGVVRRVCEAYALYRISSKVAYRYCTNSWHILDFIGVASALWASAYYKSILESGEKSGAHPVFIALILGLLWIRVLAYLKAVNEHLATFILALTRIFYDIRFFCVVLLIVVLMFGDMMHVIFLHDQSANCESEDIDPVDADFCNTDSTMHSYLRVYAIIIGDFALTDFQQDAAITVMWFCVTFIGLVVMLNTLIAVITTSYDRSEKTSIILFRRARCEFVASNAAIEGFLMPRMLSGSSWELKLDLEFVASAIARWGLLLAFLVTIVSSSLYLIQRLIAVINSGQILPVIAMLFMCLVMTCTFWAAFGYFFGLMLRMCFGRTSRVALLAKAFNAYVVEKVAAQMFGVDVTDTQGGELVRLNNDDGPDTELFDRIDRLEKTLEKFLTKNSTKEFDDTDPYIVGDDHFEESFLMPA